MAVEAGGIGARLRAGREKLGLTVLQVAERIHTDPKIVEAIEAENFEALGAPVYARGHIGHYAELVGESGSELNQLYSNVSKVAQPDLTRIVKAPAGTNSSKLVAPALLVIAVFAVAGAIWWVSALSKKKPQLSETHVVGEETPATAAPGSEAATPTPGTAPAGEPMQTGASATPAERGPPTGAMAMQARPGPQGSMAMQGGPASAGATSSRAGSAGSGGATSASSRSGAAGSAASAQALSAGSNGSTAASAPQRPGAASSTRTASTPPAPTHRSATAQTSTAGAQTRVASASPPPTQATSVPAPAAATQPRAKNQSQVTLRYSADSWTEVYDASGARLFYDVGAANSVQTVVGTPPLRVVLGNASGVSVEYNGHSKPISKLSRPDGSVQFSINRSGQVVRAKPVADGG
jgi:cytoskeleton protein RodZ